MNAVDMSRPTGTSSEVGPGRHPLPWGTLLVLWLLYVLTASGRVAIVDAGLMLDLTRALLRGQIHLSEGGVVGADAQHYCHYGLLTSIWWVPFVWVAQQAASLVRAVPLAYAEEFAVSFSGTLVMTALLAYLAAAWRLAGVDPRRMRLGLWLVGTGTLVWPYSKIIMSDPVMALALMAAYYHWRAAERPSDAWLAGLWLGLAILTRKQAQTLVPLFAGFFLLQAPAAGRWRRLLWLGAGLAPCVAVHLGYNYVRWGSPLKELYAETGPYALPGLGQWAGRIVRLLFGADRGFFVYSPPLLALAILGARCWWHRQRLELLFVAALWFSQLVFLAQFPFWELKAGGFGYRFLLFLVPLVALGWAYVPPKLSPLACRFLTASALAGLVVQLLGVTTDQLAATWRRELYSQGKGPLLLAHAGELKRALGWDRTPPPQEGGIAGTYWKHPAFQEPDFWWCHLWNYLRSKRQAPSAPGASGGAALSLRASSFVLVASVTRTSLGTHQHPPCLRTGS